MPRASSIDGIDDADDIVAETRQPTPYDADELLDVLAEIVGASLARGRPGGDASGSARPG